ncbi:MAG: hypothetical protein M1818_006018 [Claussenomyces sp. TS43310]|nr:MAG: hypothetical protein M1818_006018 [Claussenomyces sp. TS43310]
MPARVRISAPASRTYQSSAPERQVTFKPRRQRIATSHSSGTSKLSYQQTLTQLDFVNFQSDDEYGQEFNNDEEERRVRKRRKMNRCDDVASKQYTQTLTQLDFVTSTPSTSFDSCEDDDAVGVDEPLQSPQTGPLRRRGANVQSPSSSLMRSADQERDSTRATCPTTPSRRILEIPSSQSPVTPFSVCKQKAGSRSPLEEKCINSLGTPKVSTSSKPWTAINIKIEDTFDEESQENYRISDSPPISRYSDPTRKFTLAQSPNTRSSLNAHADPLFSSMLAPHDRSSVIMSSHTKASREIEDSEAESDDEAESCHGESGVETQCKATEVDTSMKAVHRNSHVCSAGKSEPRPLPSDGKPRQSIMSHISDQASHAGMECIALPEMASTHQESQRLSAQQIESMASRSDRSDIFISLHPQHVASIVSRVKDHEFRSYALPKQVTRLWIYTTRPVSAVRYMAIIGPAKRPGEVGTQSGLGNADFNARKSAGCYAYEILQLYELASPLTLAKLKDNKWLEGPPQKYVYVRPVVLDHLMAHLSRLLYSSILSPRSGRRSISSDSQEAAAQLHNTMLQFSDPYPTQQGLLSPPGRSQITTYKTLGLPSMPQDDNDEAQAKSPIDPDIRPSQATTVDQTQATCSDHSQRILYGARSQGADGERNVNIDEDHIAVVPDSPASRPSSCSIMSLPAYRAARQPLMIDGMPVPFSFPSSQLATRSQIFLDSAGDDSMLPPPLFIEDSDLEE